MKSNDAEVRTLRKLVLIAREQPVPQLDWDRVQAGLLQRVGPDASQNRLSLSESGVMTRLLGAAALVSAAVALTVVLVMSLVRSPSVEKLSSSEPVPLESDTYRVDASELSPGQRLMAAQTRLEVVDAGRARWVLDPHSSIRVVSREKPWTLELMRGAVQVEVEKGRGGFAVVAGATRVTVKGTIFGVRKEKDRALVHVERGVVQVGPASSRPGALSWTLGAGTRGVFTLDGKRVDVAEPAGRKEPATTKAAGAPKPAPTQELPAEPTLLELERGLDQVTGAITDCFRRAAAPPNTAKISIVTSLTLTISPAGRIEDAVFSPPLSPPVHACGVKKLASVRLARSQRGTRVTRHLELYP